MNRIMRPILRSAFRGFGDSSAFAATLDHLYRMGTLRVRPKARDQRPLLSFSLARPVLNSHLVRELTSIFLVLLLSLASPLRACAHCQAGETPSCASSTHTGAGNTRSDRPCHQAFSASGHDDCCTGAAFGLGTSCQPTSADAFVLPSANPSPESASSPMAVAPRALVVSITSRLEAVDAAFHDLAPPVPLFVSLHSFLI